VGYELSCFGSVSDQVDRVGVLEHTVLSTPTTLNTTELTEILNAELPPAVVQDILQVNCSLAPPCAPLNRTACSSTPHTCGACLSSKYVGVTGSSNTQCILYSSNAPTAAPTAAPSAADATLPLLQMLPPLRMLPL